jgi:adenylate cyclase class 2
MNPPQDWMRLRLRDDWIQTTLTIKEVKSHTIDGTQELEVIIDDFEVMHQMLLMMWYEPVTYQENKRISRSLDGCDVEIDTRPMLPTYAEIEGIDEKTVVNVLEKLGYTVWETTAVKVKQMYEAKWIDLHSIERLVFEE